MKAWLFRTIVGIPICFMLAIMLYDDKKFENQPPCLERATTLDPFHATSITLLHDVGQLLLSVGFVILGGLGVLAYRAAQKGGSINARHVLALSVAFASVVTSIYFGYVADVRLVEELLAHCPTVGSDAFWWSHRVQYYSLLGSGVMLFVAVLVSKERRQRED